MFTTIVMSAANLHGTMYIGAIRYLRERGMLEGLKNVIGSSSGAMAGLMLALHMTVEEMEATVDAICCKFGIPNMSITRLLSAWQHSGFLTSEWKRQYLRLIIKGKLGCNDINFRDLAKHTGMNLVVTGSNLTKMKVEYFSVETTPTMSVIEAVDISTNVPIAFRPTEWKGCTYIDGGVLDYLPVDAVTGPPESVLVLYAPLHVCTGPPKNLSRFFVMTILSLVFRVYKESIKRYPYSIALVSEENSNTVERITFRQKIVRMPKEVITRLVTQGHDQTASFFESVEREDDDCDDGEDGGEARVDGRPMTKH
jgi:predicted acylesterase/phospholipase RssA